MVDETGLDEPKVDERKVDEMAIDETAVDEIAVDEIAVDEPGPHWQFMTVVGKHVVIKFMWSAAPSIMNKLMRLIKWMRAENEKYAMNQLRVA